MEGGVLLCQQKNTQQTITTKSKPHHTGRLKVSMQGAAKRRRPNPTVADDDTIEESISEMWKRVPMVIPAMTPYPDFHRLTEHQEPQTMTWNRKFPKTHPMDDPTKAQSDACFCKIP